DSELPHLQTQKERKKRSPHLYCPGREMNIWEWKLFPSGGTGVGWGFQLKKFHSTHKQPLASPRISCHLLYFPVPAGICISQHCYVHQQRMLHPVPALFSYSKQMLLLFHLCWIENYLPYHFFIR
uniref:Uncharacterized protein n=1 Tax=Seriola lalandi dorsalis TaxID=1841481 RepID=A0A3B4Y3Z2_SERLL